MKIFLQIENNEVINVDTSQISSKDIEYDIENIDELYHQMNDYIIKDEDIEKEIIKILNSDGDAENIISYNIKHWVSNRSFGELIDMYRSGEIIKPEMQRKFVWDTLKSSRLIESIVLGLPIPPLFLLEVKNNEYEIIDGFQRLTTLVNYVYGNPWHKSGKVESKLSNQVMKEIAGKSFNALEPHYKRIIKRSTIPLIEFRELEPGNLNSKYLIFERINTGSEKLNEMQIRKALAYGNFMKELYSKSDENLQFNSLFTANKLKKDNNVEAFLRIIVMNDFYLGKHKIKKEGIKHLLNDYCEINFEKEITPEYLNKFRKALDLCFKIFKEKNNMFKKVELIQNKKVFSGIMNIGIMESLLALIMNSNITISPDQILENYTIEIGKTLEKSINKEEDNPFSVSTGSINSINKRFEICKRILEVM